MHVSYATRKYRVTGVPAPGVVARWFLTFGVAGAFAIVGVVLIAHFAYVHANRPSAIDIFTDGQDPLGARSAKLLLADLMYRIDQLRRRLRVLRQGHS